MTITQFEMTERLSVFAAIEEFDDVDEFWKLFRGKVTELRASIEAMRDDTPKTEFPLVKLNITKLQELATRNNALLPPYDLKRTQEEIESLSILLRETENRFNPRKKFTFSARNAVKKDRGGKGAKGSHGKGNKENAERCGEDDKVDSSCTKGLQERSPGSFAIAHVKDDTVVMNEVLTQGLKKDQLVKVLIEQCIGATIVAPVLLGAVRIEHVQNSNIYLGPCCTSLYLESCSGCTIFCCSHQLRIHACHGCALFVRINGHPIIEDCTTMTFAPYVLSYPGIQAHLQEANLIKAHCWGNVIDFRWHKKTVSPNWKRLEQAAWTTVNGPDGWVYGVQGQDVAAGAGAVMEAAPPAPPSAVQQGAADTGGGDDDNNNNNNDDDDDDDDEI